MPVALGKAALALHKSGSQYREALEAMSEFSALQPLDASQLLDTHQPAPALLRVGHPGAGDVSVLREAIARGESAGELARRRWPFRFPASAKEMHG